MAYWKEQDDPWRRRIYYAFPGLVFAFYFYYWLRGGFLAVSTFYTLSSFLITSLLIVEAERVVNVVNAASPPATASLHVGKHIGDRLAGRFD